MVLLWRAPAYFTEVWFFLGFGALAVGMLFALVVRMREEQWQARQARLRSAQLETELLKKGIQPHWLMNTLTSILECVEVDPARASRFIEALADEFRLLSKISGETLIPLELEIQLCRSHLAVMSLRREISFGLRTSGALAGDLVPPAVFHTLIENGLTHGTFTTGHVEFVLERTQNDGVRQYRVLSPEATVGIRDRGSEGTGLRYVRARLEESFPGRWSLMTGPRSDGWETVMQISEGERAAGA